MEKFDGRKNNKFEHTLSFEMYDTEIHLCKTPGDFASIPYKPLGKIPIDYWDRYKGISEGSMISFAVVNPNLIFLYLDKSCEFEELLENVSHELGHIARNGFSEMPPHNQLTKAIHEEKANHYKDFTMNAYKISKKVWELRSTMGK
jgi:hypothetical protein